ncbi:uncharacterized protein A1O9_09163 [Exophiala aquamarina CBS 119918]|uniref:PRISE-like Rossmann-fold domain-containing protein n=1 Tax=Exophiala aquamarina CBS 119918 TaxID=1182545 RepID=A0A072P4F8_9EURO|nr:uncharacterized protein A1O9_09163 [Exophiala aquamarina CBS 119918]KEF54721.1 hypothetical protein A1O9_09163 [Exophiala aquamarina CBS 119918]
MPPRTPKVALVTGCNGISGNAIVEHLIRQPREEWSKIVVTSRSPLKNYWQDPRVEFVAVDFLEPVQTVISTLSRSCEKVTHAYYTSYVHTDDFTKLRDYNVPLFETFLVAIDTIAGQNLERICLQTGGKHYGPHLGPVFCPMTEDLPRYEDHGLNFYYAQEDFMFDMQKQRKWSYSIIRPNGIIGFTPGKNGMSEAITLALYLLISREMGQTPKFPGNRYFYNAVDDCSYAPAIADLSVWATTQEHTKNEAFNSVNGDTYIWRYLFRRIGKYLGMEIPDQTEWEEMGDKETMAHSFRMEDWAADKKEIWNRVCDKYGGNKEAFDWGTWFFFDWSVGKAWPTLSSMSKARKFGYTGYWDSYECWIETLRAFENAGILPRNHRLHEAQSLTTTNSQRSHGIKPSG